VTLTVVEWVDLFTRSSYSDLFLESVKYCQLHKGLEVYAWCIMPSHIHMIIGTSSNPLAAILRDLKSFTSRTYRKNLEDAAFVESRRNWLLNMFVKAGIRNSANKDFQLWQQHNHPIVVDSPKILEQKINYIHSNPVEAGLVDRPEVWLYSSAAAFAGEPRVGQINLAGFN
jgi:REP element-mobilizing transposase RayT